LSGHLLDGLVDGGTRGQGPDRCPFVPDPLRDRVDRVRGPQQPRT